MGRNGHTLIPIRLPTVVGGDGTNTNCTAYSNTATNGGGWYGTNTNCTAYSNTATTVVGGILARIRTVLLIPIRRPTVVGGRIQRHLFRTGTRWWRWTNTTVLLIPIRHTVVVVMARIRTVLLIPIRLPRWWVECGTNTNCTAYSNTATTVVGGCGGTNTNCTGINNKGARSGLWLYCVRCTLIAYF